LPEKIPKKKEIKGTHIGKEVVKLLLFADDTTLYRDNPKFFIKNDWD
jgi:hypothetical protein